MAYTSASNFDWASAFGQENSTATAWDTESKPVQCLIEWGRERLLVDLPGKDQPLIALKRILEERTGIRPEQQTLLYSGFKMKDDNAALVRYGLYEPPPTPKQSTWSNLMRGFSTSNNTPKPIPPKRLVLIGSPETTATVSDEPSSNASISGRDQPSSSRRSTPAPRTEPETVARIKDIRSNSLEALAPRIALLQASTATSDPATFTDEQTHAESSTKPLSDSEFQQSFAYLSETLLQTLLKLDGLDIDTDWKEARAERKTCVKDVQAALDQLDSTKAARKSTRIL